ncbi:MAG: hypothetical protein MSB10_12290 [Clostridiales bacterium]|uniref:M56 family metallopeptidase n=1 Tax=Flavonifractor porci TaxID=3133422 RepID=UPI00309BED41|nr:hypothetical protein [Clostridiales bacterium]
MNEILLTLLSLTLSGSLLCVLLLLLRPVMGNRVPKAVSYYFWLAVLLRFLIPFGYGITLPQPPQPTQEVVRQETALPDRQDQGGTQAAPITPPSEPVTAEQPEAARPSAPTVSLPGVLVFLWLAVGTGFFCWHIATYALFSHWVRASLAPPTAEALALFEELGHSRRVRLACSDQVNAPMLLGVLRPVIVLPQDGLALPPQALAAALRHELIHARRWDICYKWLVVLVTSLHWFNPLVHWMGRRIALDCELSCDEAVLRALEPEKRMAYGDMLLLLAARPGRASPWMTAPLCQNGKRLKARLLGIKGYRKPGKAAICLTLVLGLVVTCCACTVVDLEPHPRAATGEFDPYQPLLIEYELAFLQQQPNAYPDLVSAVIAPYWGQDHQLGYVRRDLDGDGSEELLLGWVGNDIWNLDQGYVFAIYTLVDDQPVLAVEGWERSLYVVSENNILCHCGSSGAGRTGWKQYRFDPSAEGFLVTLDQVSVPVDGEGAIAIGESWMESGISLPYICFAGREESPYQDVLLGKTPFLYVDGSGQDTPTFLPDIPLAFSPYSSYAAVTEFAVLDLDGDGSREAVLRVTDVANDMGGYVVLRQEGDEIMGYPSHWRTFWQLKTDGTFTYSYSAGTEDGIASARFEEDGLTLEKHIRCEMEAWEPKAFEVDGRPVSETEYEAVLEAQAQKQDAVWYELNETNINQLTA